MRAFLEHQTLGIEWFHSTATLLSGSIRQEPPTPLARNDLRANLLFAPIPASPPAAPNVNQQFELLQDLEMQMHAYAREHQALLERVREIYVFDPESCIRDLLNEYRVIPQVLLEAAPYLKAAFGNNAVLVLRTSPETGPSTIYAVVIWIGSVRDVRQALEAFDNQWWISRASLASGRLTFTYELV